MTSRGCCLRGLVAGVLVFAGCVLPDYAKVDEPPPAAGGNAADESNTEPCCAGVACADSSVLDCVCAGDSFCCEEGWDASCAAAIEELGCGVCNGDPPDPDSEELPEQSCSDDSACSEGTPVCVEGQCAQCGDDAHCASAFPELPLCIQGICGECRADLDCQALYGADAPICDAGVCSGCATGADCPDGDTCSDGYCQ